jgi:hypothetical protein
MGDKQPPDPNKAKLGKSKRFTAVLSAFRIVSKLTP